MVVVVAAALVVAAVAQAASAHAAIAVIGMLAAAYLGTRFGAWSAVSRLGEFERRQRMWRVRNWRSGGGG